MKTKLFIQILVLGALATFNLQFANLHAQGTRFVSSRIQVVPSACAASEQVGKGAFGEVAPDHAGPAAKPSPPLSLDQLGAKVTGQYTGDGLTVEATPQGARLRCVFQKMDGEVTSEGLWLVSTVADAQGERFRVVATAVGDTPLAANGKVEVADGLARFIRPGLTEEYSVSANGVRQDFVLFKKPAGAGQLQVRLGVTAGRVEPLANGVRLVLDTSGRKIDYSRLRATDATGKELPARIEVATSVAKHRQKAVNYDFKDGSAPANQSLTGLVVAVDDTNAVYPVRIDPTFSDDNWISFGGRLDLDGAVWAMAIDGSGNLYVGGSFSIAGAACATNVAKWDGSHWSALGSGVANGSANGTCVYALAVAGINLYVGGDFTVAGGIAASNIARWNGSSWSALGSGMDAPVEALAASLTGEVYAGGDFTSAGGITVNFIAKWNGVAWSALGSGVGGGDSSGTAVYALVLSGTNLYAGGDFSIAGGLAATNVAKWDGGSWAALGAGMNGSVMALAMATNQDLYAGGSVVAKWNGSAWSSLGWPPLLGYNNEIYALAVSGSKLYAGGTVYNKFQFYESIAQWNGNTWTVMGGATNRPMTVQGMPVMALAVSGTGDLYVGGLGGNVDEITPMSGIVKWNGSSWSCLDPGGLNSRVNALAVSGSDLYIGGAFTSVGLVKANHIAKWNGTQWSALGSGLRFADGSGWVNCLAISGGNLFASGGFDTAGGIAATNIAKWNGTSWSALGSGLERPADELAASGSDLYVGGYFTKAGGVAATNIAKWNGVNWSALGGGLTGGEGYYSYVTALAISGTKPYAAVYFGMPGEVWASFIAVWNGASWSALGSGLNSAVWALAATGSNVFAGGAFTMAGDVAANYIAKWDGSSWSALGSGVNGYVDALAVSGSDLYAAGDFTIAGGTPANHVASWDGGSWSALGSGVDGGVGALAISGRDLYVSGGFNKAGGKVAMFVAKATNIDSIPHSVGIVTSDGAFGLTNGFFGFNVFGPATSNVVIQVSTNLRTWTPLVTNYCESGLLHFCDPHRASNSRCFYRVQLP